MISKLLVVLSVVFGSVFGLADIAQAADQAGSVTGQVHMIHTNANSECTSYEIDPGGGAEIVIIDVSGLTATAAQTLGSNLVRAKFAGSAVTATYNIPHGESAKVHTGVSY